MPSSPSYLAGADINPSRFVKISDDHTVIQCVADEVANGVSHEGTREAPLPDVTPLAAKTGETCRVYGADETCEVEAAGAITAGAYLKPDANGKAVVVIAGVAAVQYSAIARAAAAAGEKCKIQLVRGTLPAA